MTNQITGEGSSRSLRWDEHITTEEPTQMQIDAANNTKAAKTLLSFLYAAGEAYQTELEGGIDSENLDLFPMPVNEWAYVNAEELTMAQLEITGGLDR